MKSCPGAPPPLVSSVVVHNQLGHNQLFLEGIRRYTTGPYEVIVIDNHSTDGSAGNSF